MKIHIGNDVKTEELAGLISRGAKFVAYQYIISVPVFRPVKRISKLFFIKPGEKSSRYAPGYNFLSFLLGIWGLPFGPPTLVKIFLLNMKGGIDFTEEVMVNLQADTLIKKEINLEKPARFFEAPTKSNLKELEKVFQEVTKYGIIGEPVIAGFFINTARDESPYHVIGISSDLTDEKLQVIRRELGRKFHKHIRFEIVSLLSPDYEHVDRLRKEGVHLS